MAFERRAGRRESSPYRRPRKRRPWRLRSRELVLLAAMVLLAATAARQYLAPEDIPEPSMAGAQVYAGTPRITDGDTVRLDGVRIRLQGIDAPEMDTPEGREAKRRLSEVVGGGEIACTDTGQRSYDRVVAVCRSDEGEDLAARMVADGWAVDLPRYSGGRYAAIQREAQAQGRGMHALR